MRILLFFVFLLPLELAAQAPQPHVIHNFTLNEGRPQGALAMGPDSNVYGTTIDDGFPGVSIVFRMTPDGTLTRLVTFNGLNGRQPSFNVGLVPDGRGNFFGATDRGGNRDLGTLFRITAAGDLTTLINFNYNAFVEGMVIANDGTLYGTTVLGPNGSYGTVFRITTNGTFSTLTQVGAPAGGLAIGRDGQLYGRTYNGLNGIGFVYRVTTNGALTMLATLSGCDSAYSTALTLGNDGDFYGTTITSGTRGVGTVFRVTPQGALTTLVNFDWTNGALPAGPLTRGNDDNFYGTTIYGGIFEGTVFKLTPDGHLSTLANFPARIFGVRPYSGVIFGAEGSLYGTTYTGGGADQGMLFRVDLPPQILKQPTSSTNAVGTTATFSVSTFGTQPFSYQWLRNGSSLADVANVSGVTSDTLTLSNIQLPDAGDFSVIITNVSGNVTSSVAVLEVVVPDADGDGVPDDRDECPGTMTGAVVDAHGCSIEQLAPCNGPRGGGTWRNHGEYLQAVASAVRDFLGQGLIDGQKARNIFTAAAQSNCGISGP